MAGANSLSNASRTVVSGSGTSTVTSQSTEVVKQIVPNLLDLYASYTYNLSLSVLDDATFNSASYKTSGDPGPFLAYSANQQPKNRVNTLFGKFDFFIEDLKISHVVGFDKITKNTNAIGFEFKIVEPYSMGLFFISLQQSALEKGHDNYLDAPLLLTLAFKGHQSADVQNSTNICTKHFPLKLRLIDMRVTTAGCEYQISAYPYNEFAMEASKVTLTTSLSIKGDTILSMLKTDTDKSLELALNLREKEKKAQKLVEQEDEYVIEFPNLPDGTVNPIGISSMGFELYKGAETPFGKDNLVYENGVYKRSGIEINPKNGVFKFAQGTDLISVINQVVLMSEYGRTALTKISADGFVDWWRVEPGIEIISTPVNLASTGVKPKKYIYRVVPYRVSIAYFLPPNTKLNGASLDAKLVVKDYNYIYSGKNVDILDFDINFKTGFYTAISADASQNNKHKVTQDKDGKVVNDSSVPGIQTSLGTSDITLGQIPTSRSFSSTNTSSDNKGAGKDDPASLAAKQFHDAVTSGLDIINVEMTILGDPFYISDSGTGNYKAPATDNKYVNGDLAMSWDTGEIHILLNFKTPVDIDLSTGLYNFDNLLKVAQFSGLYRVTTLTSLFIKGVFTQQLKILRLRNQEASSGTAVSAVTAEELQQQIGQQFNIDPNSQQAQMLAAQEQGF